MTMVIKTTGFDNFLDPSGGFFVKCLIVGPPDVGKTRSASFWPKPIFALCEDGAMSIADRKTPYGRVTSTRDMDDLLDLVKRDCAKPQENRQFLTFVVDTFDAYQRVMIQERLKAENKIALSGWGDWGYLDAKMNQFLVNLMNLPMNIVVNLHPKDVTEGDDEKSTTVKAPRLKGDIKDQIFGEFDLVGFMESSYTAVKGERVRVRKIRWHNEPTYPFLKDRSGRLPRFTDVDFTEDDYQRIFDSIVGEHLEQLPESTDLMTIGSEPTPPAAADTAGGPVEVAKLPQKREPAKKATAKKAAKKAAPPVEETGTVSEPSAEPETEPSTDVQAAVSLVEANLGGEVVADTATEPAPEVVPNKPASTAAVCGSQTPAMQGKFPPAEGCGKSLEGESMDRINVGLLRTKTRLCGDCLQKWKAGQAA